MKLKPKEKTQLASFLFAKFEKMDWKDVRELSESLKIWDQDCLAEGTSINFLEFLYSCMEIEQEDPEMVIGGFDLK